MTLVTRRRFLSLLGLGTAAAAVPAIAEPIRRIWQVPSSAPVGSRIEHPGSDAYAKAWEAMMSDHVAAMKARVDANLLFGEDVSPFDDHTAHINAHTYELLHGTVSNEEYARYLAHIEEHVNALSGLNSVARGLPSPGDTAGLNAEIMRRAGVFSAFQIDSVEVHDDYSILRGDSFGKVALLRDRGSQSAREGGQADS